MSRTRKNMHMTEVTSGQRPSLPLDPATQLEALMDLLNGSTEVDDEEVIAALNHGNMTDDAIIMMTQTYTYILDLLDVARYKNTLSASLFAYLMEKSTDTWRVLAARADCPLEYLFQFAGSMYEETRIVVASNTASPLEVLDLLLNDPKLNVRFALMLNVNTSNETREYLFANGTPFAWESRGYGGRIREFDAVVHSFADYLTAKMEAYRTLYGLEDFADSLIAMALWGVEDSAIRNVRANY